MDREDRLRQESRKESEEESIVRQNENQGRVVIFVVQMRYFKETLPRRKNTDSKSWC